MIPSAAMTVLRANYVFLVPAIIFSIPSAALFGQSVLIALPLIVIGLAGVLTRRSSLASLTSAALLGLIIWGRVASDVWRLGGLDTALLLVEFLVVILLMEFSNVTIKFDALDQQLKNKEDEISEQSRVRLIKWARTQFTSLGKLFAAAFALSLGLLVIGDLVSVSIDQIAFSAILVLVAVVALLVLVTYRREPLREGVRV